MSDQLALDLEPLNLEPIAPGLTIQERFDAFDAANPWVYVALRRLTQEWLDAGNESVSIGMLVEELRWRYGIKTRGEKWRLNNSYRSRYARKIVAENPQWAEAFHLRELRAA